MPELHEEMLKETMKHYYDLFKHITTLDTGAIVVVASFLTKITGNTPNNSIVNASVTSLLLSLVFCIFGMFSVIWQMERRSHKAPLYKLFGTGEETTLIIFGICVGFFFVGILFLGVFIMNPSAKFVP